MFCLAEARRSGMGCIAGRASSIFMRLEGKMNQILDTLAASRKLEDSGVPKAQAEATVGVVNDAMKNLVTIKFLTAELDKRFGDVDKRFGKMESDIDKRFGKMKSDTDNRFSDVDKRLGKLASDMDRRFGELEAKIDTNHAKLGRSMAWGFLSLAGLMIGGGTLLVATLPFFL